MKRSVSGINSLAVSNLFKILRDVLTTETSLSELIHNNTDFTAILLLVFVNPVVVCESIISRLLYAVMYVRYMYASPNKQRSVLTAVAY